MTIKVIKVVDKKELQQSIEDFSQRFELGWIVDGRCVSELLSELEDAINRDNDVDASFEPQALARDKNGNTIHLTFNNLRGIVLETEEVV